MSNTQKLSQLKNEMLSTNLPLKETATNLVFGNGNADAKIVFIGEAPGKFEDLKGIPFIGQAGKLLDKILFQINLKREDIYITNIVKYRPPQNRPPKPQEIESFRPYLEKELEIINPKIVITLGRFAMEKFFPEEKITNIHGIPKQIKIGKLNLTLIPMYHPAAALRSTKMKQALEKDFQKNAQILIN